MIATKVGIDLSLRSPGLCVRSGGSLVSLYYWPQRKKYTHPLLTTPSPNIRLIRLTPYPDERYARMYHIVNNIMTVIREQPKPVEINIEGYAYGFANTSSLTVLAELCGHLKVMLHDGGFSWTDVYPTSVKKSFVGHGSADKTQMVTEFERREQVSLCDMLQCKAHQSPYHDLVDAYALTHFT